MAQGSTGRSRRPPGGGPDPVDVHVGSRIRQRRTALGISQEKLAATVGVTFQQVQKYERGANRIGASRLYYIAKALDVAVRALFDDDDLASARGFAEPPAEGFDSDPLRRRETIELVNAYFEIADPGLRRRFLDVARALGSYGGNQPTDQPQRRRRRTNRA
jgi:transcriptional regulator with XRE-family HTH domain